jgi:hypothetical protein
MMSLLALGGCSEDAITPSDLSVTWSDQGDTLTLFVAGQGRAMAALYSFYIEPLAAGGGTHEYLIVTAIDPAFDCAHPTTGLDSVSFLFMNRRAGATTTMLLSRSGPDFVSIVGGDALGRLTTNDDRLTGYDLDAGTVSAGAGSVAGRLHFGAGNVVLDGNFVAARCAALDFIVPG